MTQIWVLFLRNTDFSHLIINKKTVLDVYSITEISIENRRTSFCSINIQRNTPRIILFFFYLFLETSQRTAIISDRDLRKKKKQVFFSFIRHTTQHTHIYIYLYIHKNTKQKYAEGKNQLINDDVDPVLCTQEKSVGQFFFFSSLSSSFVRFDDVSQCVDMKKHDDATTTITTTVAIVYPPSRQYRGLSSANQTVQKKTFFFVFSLN